MPGSVGARFKRPVHAAGGMDTVTRNGYGRKESKEMGRLRSLMVLSVVLALCLASLALAGCNDKSSDGGAEAFTVTDLAGRSVELKAPAERVVAVGPGALRLVCYCGAADQVVGIEQMEKQWGGGRPYILANEGLLSLPVIGQGGPDSAVDPEALLNADPDVIFAAYLLDASKADDLQQKTGIPVVVLSYGQLGTFDQQLMDSIELVGKVTGNQKRAGEVVEYIQGCQQDLDRRTAGIAAEKKPTAYAGGLGMKGSHGIESTQTAFPPLMAVNARNVVDEAGVQGWSVMIDKEQLLEWDPDVLFIDESGLQMVQEDYAGNPGFYRALKAVQNGRVYGYLPYNFYTTNVDTAVSDAYFMGKTLYPDAFADVDPVAKADEIYVFLLGRAMYEQMARDFGGFVQLDPGTW